ncbi:MAG: hypothetical protein ACLRJV_08135 [Eubacteriales bacterium]
MNSIANANNCNLIPAGLSAGTGLCVGPAPGREPGGSQRGLTTSGTAIFLPFRSCEYSSRVAYIMA